MTSQFIAQNNIELAGKWRISLSVSDTPVMNSIQQVHGNAIVNAKDKGSAIEADGLYVEQDNIKATIHTADCLPLVLLTERAGLILHVSRKSLIKGILDEVAKFIAPNEITDIYFGPHICSRHFVFPEPGDDIVKFQNMFPNAVVIKKDGRHLSLRLAVQQYLNQWGINTAKIFEDKRCTFEDTLLPSYKREIGNKALGRIITTLQSY